MPRASANAALSWCAALAAGAITTSNGDARFSRAMAARVSSSSGFRTSLMSSAQHRDQVADSRGLAIERHDDRVDQKVVVAERARPLPSQLFASRLMGRS